MKSIIALIMSLPILMQGAFVNLSGNIIDIAKNKTTDYVIVRPSNATFSMTLAASTLSKSIKAETGATVSSIGDTNKLNARASGLHEILIGPTNRAASKGDFSHLDEKDFAIKEIDGAVVIRAGSDAAYVDAVNYIDQQFIKEKSFSIPSGYDFTYLHEYEIASLSLCGNDISEYSIIHGGGYTKELAENLAAEILAKTGKTLKLVEGETAKTPAISVLAKDSEKAPAEYSVNGKNGNVVISSQTGMGLKTACEAFTSALFYSDKKQVEISDFTLSGTAPKAGGHEEFLAERTPLSNTRKKLYEDKELKVAYLGGSVTVGFGATDPAKYSWRALTTQWLKDTFPMAEITEIDATIGGSGSHLGAFRLQRDVIPFEPDLFFVECGVNDSYTPETYESAAKNFEALVRQIRKELPNCDIITVYVTDSSKAAKSDTEPLYTQAAAHDMICEIYGIDSVNVGAAIAKDFDLKSTLSPRWNTFFIDGVHNSNKGYEQYALTIQEHLANRLIFEAPTPAAPHALPEVHNPLADVPLQYIMYDQMPLENTVGVSVSDKVFRLVGSNDYIGYIAITGEDNSMEFEIDGTELSLFIYGLNYSNLHFEVDGKKGSTYVAEHTNSPIRLFEGLEPGKHRVKLTIKLGKSTEGKIAAFLVR